MDTRIIALYLPQFYPFKENDRWWGKGFTEWTNVGRAKPLFKGHYQPRVPADLGYYNLRMPEVRIQQAELARQAGVNAFCYWHYWFGNGRQLLADVFNEVLSSGKPDFPFCLGWANHSWYAKTWDRHAPQNELLMEQLYPGIDDAIWHIEFLIKAFVDNRYVKVNGKPFLFVFDPDSLPETYIEVFRERVQKAGFDDLYLVANISPFRDKSNYIKKGFSAVVFNRLAYLRDYKKAKEGKFCRLLYQYSNHIRRIVKGIPVDVLDYGKNYPFLIDRDYDAAIDVIPQIVPQWDHSPRGGAKENSILHNSAPLYFHSHVKQALDAIKNKPKENQIILLKSWNEWAEGNYMEPDLKYGHGYIDALRNAIDKFEEELSTTC